nr:MAG TPA: hypothetical protein [Crassvirales sp.]
MFQIHRSTEELTYCYLLSVTHKSKHSDPNTSITELLPMDHLLLHFVSDLIFVVSLHSLSRTLYFA